MENISKPFEALASRWRSDVFFRTRVKLAGMYMLAMLIVTVSYSATLYFYVGNENREEFNQYLREGTDTEQFFEERQNAILDMLLLVDGTVLVVSCAAAYIFAGYTLKPINSILRAQERFAADAAHELRTPLAVIQSQIEVLLRSHEPVSSRIQDSLTLILDETKGLTDITTNLLHAARQDMTMQRKEPSVISVSGVAAEVVESLRIMAKQKRITIELDSSPDLSVRAERDGLKRIFTNVIDNALRYAPEQGHIRVSVAEDGAHWVCILVEDNGSGISAKDLPHVFERLYKADNARQGSGTGLGLSIVKELVGSYGGSIGIDSELGHGTTVTMRLKRAS